ncbi:MAG: NUDIX domain-containing protein [Nostocoides sp.]
MSARIEIVATERTDCTDREVGRFVLPHGGSPVDELAARGWVPVPPTQGTGRRDGQLFEHLPPAQSAVTEPGEPWTVTITYAVRAASPIGPGATDTVTHDEDLTDAEVANAEVYQRIAAYAFVSSSRGLLLTELSDATNASGQWNLPGGGLDEGEPVDDALRREIWEEAGQRVDKATLLGVLSSHWVGRAPRGRIEDYHAVRLIHRATCPEPTDPVIHDLGGSTSAVRWVPWTDVGQVPLVGSFASLIREVTGRHLAGS